MSEPRSVGVTIQALIFFAAGVAILMLAGGVIDAPLKAPRGVVACFGLAFAGCGLAQLSRPYPRLGMASSATAVFGIGCVFLWAALQPGRGTVSAPPFVPEAAFRAFVRVLAGLCGLGLFAAAAHLVVRVVRGDSGKGS